MNYAALYEMTKTRWKKRKTANATEKMQFRT